MKAETITLAIEGLKIKRGRLTMFAPEYTITETGNKTGPMWKPYNLTQPKIDAIDAALADLEAERDAPQPRAGAEDRRGE